MIRQRIKLGNARRGSRAAPAPAPALVLTLTGATLTWSPRDPAAIGWTVNIYDLSGNLLDSSGMIDASDVSVNINDQWDPPPFQISIQAQGDGGVNFGPVSNKVTWLG